MVLSRNDVTFWGIHEEQLGRIATQDPLPQTTCHGLSCHIVLFTGPTYGPSAPALSDKQYPIACGGCLHTLMGMLHWKVPYILSILQIVTALKLPYHGRFVYILWYKNETRKQKVFSKELKRVHSD